MGDDWIGSIWFSLSATVALGLGDGVRARRPVERSLSLGREIGVRETVSVALPTLATIARSEGDLGLDAALFGEGPRLSYEVGERTNVAYYLEELTEEISASEVRLERAARL